MKVYPNGEPELAKTMYALVDDQSNKTLERSKLFDLFKIEQETGVLTCPRAMELSLTQGVLLKIYVLRVLVETLHFHYP